MHAGITCIYTSAWTWQAVCVQMPAPSEHARLPGQQANPAPLDCTWVHKLGERCRVVREGSIEDAQAAMKLTKGQMLNILQLESLPVLDLTAEQQLVHQVEAQPLYPQEKKCLHGASARLMAPKWYPQRPQDSKPQTANPLNP